MLKPAANAVIEHFRGIVKPDGGELEVLGLADGVLRLRYRAGHNPDCESCVLTPDDLGELVAEAIQARDPSIKSVELVTH